MNDLSHRGQSTRPSLTQESGSPPENKMHPKSKRQSGTMPALRHCVRCYVTPLLVFLSFAYSFYMQKELTNCQSTTLAPITAPPITAPPVSAAPITAPPISSPPITAPPVTAPPISQPLAARQEAPKLRMSSEIATPKIRSNEFALPKVRFNGSCKKLNNGGPINVVWAWHDPPTGKAMQKTIDGLPTDVEVVVYCGSTACVKAAKNSGSCVSVQHMIAPALARGTPMEDWVGDHVLSKILSGPHFEETLQIVMQLVILYQSGGMVVLPGLDLTNSNLESKIQENPVLWKGLVNYLQPGGGGVLWKEKNSFVRPGGGGGILAAAAKPKDGFVRGLMELMLVEYNWPNYVAAKWPVKIEFDNVCGRINACKRAQQSLENDLAIPQADISKSALAKKPKRQFGTLSYQARRHYLLSTNNRGMNRGDEMQGLGGLQFIPRLDAFVERDRLDVVNVINSTYFSPSMEVSTETPARLADIPTTVFLNAWWGTPNWVWPPPGKLEPIFVAMHLNTRKAKDDIKAHKDYLDAHWPIGARDSTTDMYFRSIGLHSVFSACMTMTLLPSWDEQRALTERTNDILLVDVSDDAVRLLPDHIISNVKELSAKLLDQNVVGDQVARYFWAHDMKMHLQKAKLVITQRLHVALPAASMGTPVVLILGNNLPGGGGAAGLARFSGLQDAVHTVDAAKGKEELADFNWDQPPPNPNSHIIKLRRNALRALTICHTEGEVADSARKFGVIPPTWEYPEENRVCSGDSLNSDNQDTIHIATAINPDWLDKDPVLSSWVHALYQSNANEKFVFYFLTNNMTAKQRCLVRFMVLRWFPDAEVYTMPMDEMLAKLPYTGIKHVPLVTQSRLFLPLVLHCVDRLLWIDIDTMVIHPLKYLWDEWAVMPPCGVVGRTSVDKDSMANMVAKLDSKHFQRVWKKASKDRPGFNAGVMIMDLKTLRKDHFTERIASYWSFTLGGNDQISMNMQCNGTHGQLDPTWNVFQRYPDDPVYERPDEWKLVHFQGSIKPWLKDSESEHKKIWDKFTKPFVYALYGPGSDALQRASHAATTT